MIVIAPLRSCRPSFLMSVSSIEIEPPLFSTMRKREMVIVLFPDPVLPTIPIFSDGLNVQVTFLRAGARSSLYLTSRSVTSIFPLGGQFSVNAPASLSHLASGVSLQYSLILSTATTLVSTSDHIL